MILGIGHTAYGVADLSASLRFYVEQLGLEEAFRLNRNDGSLWIVYLYVGNGGFVELFPEDDSSTKNTGSYKHLCLTVDDMSETVVELKKRGLELLSSPSVGSDGNTQAWIADPDGNLIELMQIASDSQQDRFLSTFNGSR